MTKEEMKNKYSSFITEISEILGLGKPIDILKLCEATDLFFRPLDKRIEELKKENAILEKRCANYKEEMEKNLADAVKLEKENAELLCQKNRNKSCYSCVNATERCFRNEIGCPCQKYKSYKEENAELTESYFYTRCIASNCPYIHKENRNCTKFGGFFTAVSNGNCPMMKNLNANIKLAKSKELIRDFLSVAIDYIDKEDKNYSLILEAEQFLKDSKQEG